MYYQILQVKELNLKWKIPNGLKNPVVIGGLVNTMIEDSSKWKD